MDDISIIPKPFLQFIPPPSFPSHGVAIRYNLTGVPLVAVFVQLVVEPVAEIVPLKSTQLVCARSVFDTTRYVTPDCVFQLNRIPFGTFDAITVIGGGAFPTLALTKTPWLGL